MLPGTSGGPASTTQVSEQSYPIQIPTTLGFISAHLHLNDAPSSHMFENITKHFCKYLATTIFVIGHDQATSGICQSSLEPTYAQRYQIARKCGEVCYSNDYQKMDIKNF